MRRSSAAAATTRRAKARDATAALERLVSGGQVALTAIEGDKYFGRVIADVATLAVRMSAPRWSRSGYARTYDGGERHLWCGVGYRQNAPTAGWSGVDR